VSLANLKGSNRAYIEREIPHIASLMADSIADVVASSDVLIVGNAADEFRNVPDAARDDQVVIDLVRILPDTQSKPGYHGMSW
jgi:GDP-mannose 6-dehydrogenase